LNSGPQRSSTPKKNLTGTLGGMNLARSMKQISDYRFALVLTLLYAASVSVFSFFHEVWRDEVVVLSLVTESHSLLDLLHSLRNFGHPPLFHILVYFGHKILPHPIVLKIINVAICTAAAYIFLIKAPFSRLQRVFFIGGILPLYIYPVFNRSYGLAMLFIFIVSTLYKDRYRRFIPFSIALVLLASVHSHMFIVAMAIVLSMIVEIIFIRENVADQQPNFGKLVTGALILGAGLIYLIRFMMPDNTSLIFQVGSIGVSDLTNAFFRAIALPGVTFKSLFGMRSALFANIIIGGFYVYLLRKRHLTVLFISGVIALTMFFILVYPSQAFRHQGVLYLMMIFILWVDTYPSREFTIPWNFLARMQKYIAANKNAFFTFLLIMHVCMAYWWINRDIRLPYSSAKALAQFINENPAYRNAIIVAEPEALQESLAYYVDNRFYFYRESRFGKFRTYDTGNNNDATLTDLLTASRQLQKDHDALVIILIKNGMNQHGPYLFSEPYGRTFSYTADSLRDFLDETDKIAFFHGSLSDENCDVYLLGSNNVK